MYLISIVVGIFCFQFIICIRANSSNLNNSPENLVNVWLTTSDTVTGDAILLLEEQSPIKIAQVVQTSSDSEEVRIDINPSIDLQTIVGYGAGLPQSSAYVLINLKRNNKHLYFDVMENLFGSGKHGAKMSALRFPVGSCDFSIRNTTYDEHSGDFDLEWFALDPDSEYIVEVLHDALSLNPDITLIASPWSPPSWMKTMNSLIALSEENTLVDTDQVYNSYAQYFAKIVDGFAARGLNISYLTLQNEPLFGTSQEYPGMYFSAEQAIKLSKLVRQVLPKHVGILAYDHNWDHPEYPLSMISNSPESVSGVAWHCYGGDMAPALDSVQSKYPYPSYPQHVTECTGGYPDSICDLSKGLSGFGYNHEWDMSNLFLGASSHYAVSGIKWIIALDENCGPVLPLVSWRSGRPVVSIPSTAKTIDDIRFNQDYWTIAHMSKFVNPGSYRVSSSIKAAKDTTTSSIISESFYSSTSELLTTIVMNTGKAGNIHLNVNVGVNGTFFQYNMPPFSTVVFQPRI